MFLFPPHILMGPFCSHDVWLVAITRLSLPKRGIIASSFMGPAAAEYPLGISLPQSLGGCRLATTGLPCMERTEPLGGLGNQNMSSFPFASPATLLFLKDSGAIKGVLNLHLSTLFKQDFARRKVNNHVP